MEGTLIFSVFVFFFLFLICPFFFYPVHLDFALLIRRSALLAFRLI